MRRSALALVLVPLSGITFAAQPIAPAQPAAAPPAKEKKVCRREEVSGSLIPKTTCRSREQWAALDGQAQRNMPGAEPFDTKDYLGAATAPH